MLIIIFCEGPEDLKQYVMMTDLYMLCRDVMPWGGAGVIICSEEDPCMQDKDRFLDEKWYGSQVRFIQRSGDVILVTPDSKPISWLVQVLMHPGSFGILGVWRINTPHLLTFCLDCVKAHPEFSAREMLLEILNSLICLQNKTGKEADESLLAEYDKKEEKWKVHG